jgi:hypothetical protein
MKAPHFLMNGLPLVVLKSRYDASVTLVRITSVTREGVRVQYPRTTESSLLSHSDYERDFRRCVG